MAVDKSYGSGKSRSAANSRARRRAAAGNFTKGPKTITRALKKIAAENPMTGFISGGILPAKLMKAASALRASGQVGKAAAFEARAGARLAGKSAAVDIAAAGGKSYLNSPRGQYSIVGAGVPTKTFEGATLRSSSRSVFPNAPKKGSLGDLEFLPGMTKTQAAAKMLNTKAKAAYRAKIRAKIEGTRVTELEKRLNLPRRGR